MNTRMIPVKDHASLVRDPLTGSIVNRNRTEYNTSMAVKQKAAQVQSKIDSLEKQINRILRSLETISSKLDKTQSQGTR